MLRGKQVCDKRRTGQWGNPVSCFFAPENRAFVEQQNGEVEVASGQCVYLKVENCWIPVVVRYSARRKKWYFKYLEEIPVCGQKVLLKA